MDTSHEESQTSGTSHDWRQIVCTGCGHTHDVPIYCGDRFCATCSGTRQTRVRARIKAITSGAPALGGFRWRFLTLTVPTSDSLADSIAVLSKSFRKLRQRKWWKDRVWGGASVYEFTHTNNRWHLHVHALVFSAFLPQHDLAKLWAQVSPGRIVDIRLIPTRAAVHYVTKYVTKTDLSTAERRTAKDALASRRLFTVFGLAHAIKYKAKPEPFPCPKCGGTDWQLFDVLCHQMSALCDSS